MVKKSLAYKIWPTFCRFIQLKIGKNWMHLCHRHLLKYIIMVLLQMGYLAHLWLTVAYSRTWNARYFGN